MIYRNFNFADWDTFVTKQLHVYDFGVEKREDESYAYDNERRQDYDGFLFQYTLEGKGFFEQEDRVVSLTPGKAFLIPFPHGSKYYYKKEEEHGWTFFYIHFNGEIAKQYCTYMENTFGNILTIDQNADSIQCFLREYTNVQNGKQYGLYNNSVFLYQFLTLLLQDLESPSYGKKIGCVEQAVVWLEQNFSTQKNLSDMCIELGVSLSHLTRQFHLQKGITPMQYLQDIRLKHSLNLLVTSTLLIEEIAIQCGFSNGNYYTKVFRRSFGLTPSAYRLLHGGKSIEF
ncbi:AraC family transcriptional regulator [Anaerosporobacter faecicola]|uniref:AraC family transcriptional regulator n=1 Tax=Anaerosporobacter faecicola TaxID=2718714 RepID=UPI00143930BE|nr:AraC family transcriptional regulator [Anaerosporobacter faecicola]